MKFTSAQKSSLLLLLMFVAGILLAFAVGFMSRDLFAAPGADLPLLSEARKVVADNFYGNPPGDQILEYGMVRGLVDAYGDPFTTFIEPPQHELQSQQLAGSFGGIGARLERDSEGYIRLYPLPDSPSLKAGIQDADRLVQVDDLALTPQTDTAAIEAAIRGPVGETVRLTVTRPPSTERLPFDIQRAQVNLPSTTYNLVPEEPRAGLIRTNVIAATTPDEIKAAVAALKAQGATVFVLDLRNNGGGLVEAGVDAARLFLREGDVLTERYRDREPRTYTVKTPGELSDIPLVVLINGNTASAAEILAGALQARGRSKLAGAPSYGKDSIQLVFDLSDGSSVHVTAAKWEVPGASVPLQPDIPQADDPNSNALLMAAVRSLLPGE